MNRREQKKHLTFAAITEAAEASFDKIGYDATSIESIAQAAGVSAGTVYNYFGTKSTILAAIVTEQTGEVMGEIGESLDLAAANPPDALMPILEAYVRQMTAYGPELLKELLRAAFDPGQTELLAELVTLDEQVLVQLSASLGSMRALGMLSSTVDVEGAALLVYSIVAIALMTFASIPGTTPEDVLAACRLQLGIAFDGLVVR